MTAYPEHERLAAIKPDAETIQAFLDWLLDDFRPRGGKRRERVWLASWKRGDDGHEFFSPVRETREQIMAAFFKIDLDQIEREKAAMLAEIRAGAGGVPSEF